MRKFVVALITLSFGLSSVTYVHASHEMRVFDSYKDAGLRCQGPYTESGKAQYGRVRPIQDHPNLFWNQSEVNQLRRMILVDKNPTKLANLYEGNTRKARAQEAPSNWTTTHPQATQEAVGIHWNNMRAAISYMIEPTDAKARDIRDSIISFMRERPNGVQGGVSEAYVGTSLALMLDLLKAYHPNIFDGSSKSMAEVEEWYLRSANRVTNARQVVEFDQGKLEDLRVLSVEGKMVSRYPNWYSHHGTTGLLMALVAGDQTFESKDAQYYIDYWAQWVAKGTFYLRVS